MKTVIEMAREAGGEDGWGVGNVPSDPELSAQTIVFFGPDDLERFAKLVAAAAIKDAPDYKMGYSDGVAAEREACAKVCEQSDEEGESPDQWDWHSKDYAAAIRARGQE